MSDISLFDVTLPLDVTADVSVDFSAGQGYSSGTRAWQVRLVVDGVDNSSRGGSGGYSDNINLIGACGRLAPGNHRFQILWWGADSSLSVSGAVMRVLITRK